MEVSAFSDLKMQYTIKPGNSCVRHDALFNILWAKDSYQKAV